MTPTEPDTPDPYLHPDPNADLLEDKLGDGGNDGELYPPPEDTE